jgi:hypothetical protein
MWDGWCSLAIPPGWSWGEDDGVVSLTRPDGVGAFQMSFATRERYGPAGADEALELAGHWAHSRGWADVGLRARAIGGTPAAELEYIEGAAEDATYWKAWHVVESRRAVLMTYVCALSDAELERVEREEIAESFRWE